MQAFPNPNKATHTNSLSLQAGLVKFEFKKQQTPDKDYIPNKSENATLQLSIF